MNAIRFWLCLRVVAAVFVHIISARHHEHQSNPRPSINQMPKACSAGFAGNFCPSKCTRFIEAQCIENEHGFWNTPNL